MYGGYIIEDHSCISVYCIGWVHVTLKVETAFLVSFCGTHETPVRTYLLWFSLTAFSYKESQMADSLVEFQPTITTPRIWFNDVGVWLRISSFSSCLDSMKMYHRPWMLVWSDHKSALRTSNCSVLSTIWIAKHLIISKKLTSFEEVVQTKNNFNTDC